MRFTDRPIRPLFPDGYRNEIQVMGSVLSADGLVDLKQLVTIADLSGRSDEQVKTVYHQSYALVTWMSRFRKTELRNYLLSMLKEPPGQPESQRHLELFEQAFGDVDKLERSWLRHEVSLLSSASAATITRRRLAAYEQPLHWGGAQYRAQEPVGLAKVFADAAYNYNPLSISLVAAVGSEAAEIEELDSGALLITGVLWE